MPFTLPKTVQRNPLRYVVVESTDDFLLQRHRRSLRTHPFPFRIITADKPHIKLAKNVSLDAIQAREWKFLIEELPNRVPPRLALANCRRAAAGALGGEDSAPAGGKGGDTLPATWSEECLGDGAVVYDVARLQERRHWLVGYLSQIYHETGDDVALALDDGGLGDLLSGDEWSDGADSDGGGGDGDGGDGGGAKHRRQDSAQSRGNASTGSGGGASPLSATSLASLKRLAGFNALNRHSSAPQAVSAGPAGGGSGGGGAAASDAAAARGRRWTRRISTKLETVAELPAYLLYGAQGKRGGRTGDAGGGGNGGGGGATARGGRATRITMQQLKREHEKLVMARTVAVVTLVALVLRVLNWQAFIVVLMLCNAGALWVVKNRRRLIRRIAASSVKRRGRWAKAALRSRWGWGGWFGGGTKHSSTKAYGGGTDSSDGGGDDEAGGSGGGGGAGGEDAATVTWDAAAREKKAAFHQRSKSHNSLRFRKHLRNDDG